MSEGPQKSTLTVVARFAVKPECITEFVELAEREMVAPTQSEPGCIRYELWQEAGDPVRFAMIEEWESEEALQVHLAQESLQVTLKSVAPMAAEAVSMQRYVKPASA